MQISNLSDVRRWVENYLDVDSDESAVIARAIWDRKDFPHPVNNSNLSEYFDGLDAEELLSVFHTN